MFFVFVYFKYRWQQPYQMVRQLIYKDLSKYFLLKIARYRTPNARFRTLLSRKLSISLQWVRVRPPNPCRPRTNLHQQVKPILSNYDETR